MISKDLSDQKQDTILFDSYYMFVLELLQIFLTCLSATEETANCLCDDQLKNAYRLSHQKLLFVSLS